MPWCPRCGSEYRAGVARCADCDEALVEEPPRLHGLAPAGEQARAEAPVASRRRPRMAVLWLVLAVLAVMQATGAAVAVRYGETTLPALQANEGFRWQFAVLSSHLRSDWLVPSGIGTVVTAGITTPFGGVPLISVARNLVENAVAERGRPPGDLTGWLVRATYARGIVFVLLWPVVLALALQWIVLSRHQDAATGRGYWRSAVGVIPPLLAFSVIWIGFLVIAAGFAIRTEGAVLWAISLVHGIGFPLTLTPFLIVGRRVGLRAGVVGAFRIVRAQWRHLLVIVILYRTGYLIIEFIATGALFVAQISLLPAQSLNIESAALYALRHAAIAGLHPAVLLGWASELVPNLAGLALDVALCLALMSLVMRATAPAAMAQAAEGV